MITALMKYFTINICSIYLYSHITNVKKNLSVINSIFTLIYSLLISSIYILLPKSFSFIYIPLIIVFLYLYFIIMYKTDYLSVFITTIIAYGLSYASFALTLFVIVLLSVVFNISFLDNQILFQIAILVTQLLIDFLIFRIKRFKKGMPFLKNKKFNIIGTYSSVIIIICITFLKSGSTNILNIIPFVFIFLSLIFLFIWWRSKIQQTYITKLTDREFEYLKNEIAELKKDNEVLSKLVHKDNKIIPALELSVRDFISHHSDSINEANDLISQLEKLSVERKGIIKSCVSLNRSIPSTSFISTDALMNYMYQKAASADISFGLSITGNANKLIDKHLSETDLNTILADLIENAIIATTSNSGKHIFVDLIALDDFKSLDIYDSGTTFDTKVLLKLGTERITTHKDFGTGIGLTSTFELCHKCGASILIDETINADRNYSKKISIIFDNKSEYRLKSIRTPDEQQYLSTRSDLILEN